MNFPFLQYATDSDIALIGIGIVLSILVVFKIRKFIRYFGRQRLLRRNRTLKKLKKLPWDKFEILCAELFKLQGWKTRCNTQNGADGGVDIWMKRRSVRAIVQCKRYNTTAVGVKVVREMYGLMYEYKVDRVYIVTTSYFTHECYSFVEGKEIELINGSQLLKMLN